MDPPGFISIGDLRCHFNTPFHRANPQQRLVWRHRALRALPRSIAVAPCTRHWTPGPNPTRKCAPRMARGLFRPAALPMTTSNVRSPFPSTSATRWSASLVQSLRDGDVILHVFDLHQSAYGLDNYYTGSHCPQPQQRLQRRQSEPRLRVASSATP